MILTVQKISLFLSLEVLIQSNIETRSSYVSPHHQSHLKAPLSLTRLRYARTIAAGSARSPLHTMYLIIVRDKWRLWSRSDRRGYCRVSTVGKLQSKAPIISSKRFVMARKSQGLVRKIYVSSPSHLPSFPRFLDPSLLFPQITNSIYCSHLP